MPEVSAVIPAYNAARYLGEAIDSALAQTFRDLEIIVIDDGSTDDTARVVARYGGSVRSISQPNRGVSSARNRGIEESRGRYVAFLDADDVWMPAKLQRQLEALRENPQTRACYSAHLWVDDRLAPLRENRGPRRGTALEDLLRTGNVVGSPSSVIVERSIFSEVGGFSDAFSLCADWEMWVRIAARTEFAYINEPLVQYRVHADSMSRNVPLLEDESIRTLESGFAAPSTPLQIRKRRRSSLAHNYMVLAGSYFQARRIGDAFRCALQSVLRDPRQLAQLGAFTGRYVSGGSTCAS